MKEKEADIVVKNLKPAEVHNIVLGLSKEDKIKKGGVGLYRHYVHYDVRGYNTRWKGTGLPAANIG